MTTCTGSCAPLRRRAFSWLIRRRCGEHADCSHTSCGRGDWQWPRHRTVALADIRSCMRSVAECLIQLPQGSVADNIPNRPNSQRARDIEIARGSWGQLQWLFGGIVVDQAQISDCYAYAKRESRQEESQASGYSLLGKLNSQPSSNRARQLFQ